MTPSRSSPKLRADALAIWRAGVDAVQPAALVARAVRVWGANLTIGGTRLPLDRLGRLVVVGGGKAASAMVAGLEAALGPALLRRLRARGHVNVIDGFAGATPFTRLHAARPAGSPLPTPEGARGCRRMLALAAGLTRRDLVVCLLSGGASALMPLPPPGITVAEKSLVTGLLSRAGASIAELNAVRKHLSLIKGGRLAQAARPATVISLILSDVIGNPLDVIASGPTAPDPTTFADALAVLDRYGLRGATPPSVLRRLEAGAGGRLAETPESVPRGTHHVVIGDIHTALRAAAAAARRLGYEVREQGGAVAGEARLAGAALARAARAAAPGLRRPLCILSGGEPVVSRVAPGGCGGRSQEFALAACTVLLRAGSDGTLVMAAGTDGEDGPTDAAGAWVDAGVLEAARRLHLNPRAFLAASTSWDFFRRTGGLVRTGPTGTNVMDIHIALITKGP